MWQTRKSKRLLRIQNLTTIPTILYSNQWAAKEYQTFVMKENARTFSFVFLYYWILKQVTTDYFEYDKKNNIFFFSVVYNNQQQTFLQTF